LFKGAGDIGNYGFEAESHKKQELNNLKFKNMHPEIEKLIGIALQDGILTDKEREIIFRKAETLGIDKDEIEMILEGKLHEIKQKSNQSFHDVEKKEQTPFSKFKSFVDKVETKFNEPEKQDEKQGTNIFKQESKKSDNEPSGFDKLSPQNKKYTIVGVIAFVAILLVVGLTLENKSKDKIEKERDRIERIIDDVNSAITNKEWDKAEPLILKIKWELNEVNTSGYSDDYDKRREELQKLLDEKKQIK